MKKLNQLFFSVITALLFTTIACSKNAVEQDDPTLPPPPVLIEVKIGDKIWSKSNLDVSTFSDGEIIPEAKSEYDWKQAGINATPAWCYYDNDPANGAKYGKLYNWYAVTHIKGLAPTGWHIPTELEWTDLANTVGGLAVDGSGSQLKNTSGWNDYMGQSGNGTNTSGFTGLPGGGRHYQGLFFADIGTFAFWWSTSADPLTGGAFSFTIKSSNTKISRDSRYKNQGYSVRCVKN